MLTLLFQNNCIAKKYTVHLTLAFLFFIAVIISGTSCTKKNDCQYCAENNKWPVANAGKDTIIVSPVDNILLNGIASFDPMVTSLNMNGIPFQSFPSAQGRR